MGSYIVMSRNEDGSSALKRIDAPEFSDMDFPACWLGKVVEDSGIFMFTFDISAEAAEFPIHVSEDEWLAYVISGSGVLFAGTAGMEKTNGVAYQAGDFIAFDADTPHGWKNDGGESQILFVKRS